LVECGEGCGRKFNPDSIVKHENVCRQVFQKKRKEFNAQDQRLVANEQKKLMKKGEVVERKLEEKKAREKVPKWKAESLALRSGIKQALDDDYVPTKEEKKILDDARNNDFTKCQFCGRSFNEAAAKKHIAFCESQQKKNQMRKK
jgi:predicted RecB family nuclease